MFTFGKIESLEGTGFWPEFMEGKH